MYAGDKTPKMTALKLCCHLKLFCFVFFFAFFSVGESIVSVYLCVTFSKYAFRVFWPNCVFFLYQMFFARQFIFRETFLAKRSLQTRKAPMQLALGVITAASFLLTSFSTFLCPKYTQLSRLLPPVLNSSCVLTYFAITSRGYIYCYPQFENSCSCLTCTCVTLFVYKKTVNGRIRFTGFLPSEGCFSSLGCKCAHLIYWW